MNDLNTNLNNFINPVTEQEVCDPNTGKCYIRTKDGLIEKTMIEKRLVVEDGRELLREELPVSNSTRTYLR
jgi:hypothetical protein